MFGRRKLVHSQLVIKLNGCRCRHMEIMVPFYPTYCAYLDSLVLQTMSFGDAIHTMALLLQVLYFPLSIRSLKRRTVRKLEVWLLSLATQPFLGLRCKPSNCYYQHYSRWKKTEAPRPGDEQGGTSWVSSALEIRIVKWWLMLSGDCSILFKIGCWDWSGRWESQ